MPSFDSFIPLNLGSALSIEVEVDMRKSWNGLVKLVKEGLNENPLDGTAYVFINKRGSLLKIVLWDRTGYVIVSKKLEVGKFLLSTDSEKQELHIRELSATTRRIFLAPL